MQGELAGVYIKMEGWILEKRTKRGWGLQQMGAFDGVDIPLVQNGSF